MKSLPEEESKVLEVLATIEPPEQARNTCKEQADTKRQQVPSPKDRQHQTKDQHDRCSLGCYHVKCAKDQNRSQKRRSKVSSRESQALCPPVAHIGRQPAQVWVHGDRFDLSTTHTCHARMSKLVQSNRHQLNKHKVEELLEKSSFLQLQFTVLVN